MSKNITLKLSENLLKRCKHAAVESDQSVSEWVAKLIAHTLDEKPSYLKAKERALKALREGVPIGGKYLSREETHER